MIVIYPMLISQAVSENIIPGISKTIEGYILANAKSAVVDNPDVNRNFNFKIKNKKLVAYENIKLPEDHILYEDDIIYDDDGAPYGSSEDWDNPYSPMTVKKRAQTQKDYEDRKRDQKKRDQRKKDLERLKKSLKQDAIRRRIKNYDDEEKRLQKIKDDLKKDIRQRKIRKYDDEEKRENERDYKEAERQQKVIDDLKKDARQRKIKKHDDIEKRDDERAYKEKERLKSKEEELEKEKIQDEKDRIEIEKRATAKVSIQDNRALSIEPSLIELDIVEKNGNIKHEVIGVKIVPLRVKSDIKLSRLILHDTQVSFISSKVLGLGRSITRLVYKFFGKIIEKFGGSSILSGNPRRDIIMGRTGFKGEGFIVLSKNEDIDEIFLSNISKMNRLFKMGWNNIIVVDDIQRQVHFCMKIFKGTCTTLAFSTIYQNLNHLGVYESLEDAKRKTSMIFKIGKKAKNIFSECIIQNKISKYLNREKYNNE